MVLMKSMLLGLAVAAPVGPIGLLCMQRTLMYGRRAGFYSGLGAATADMLYAMLAAFGFVTLTAVLTEHTFWLQLMGSLFLVRLGWGVYRQQSPERSARSNEYSLRRMYASTFALTVTNPLTVLSFVAMFAGLGLEVRTLSTSVELVAGVFLGSAVWWLFLSIGVEKVGHRFSPSVLSRINRIAGGLLMVLGAVTMYNIWIG